MARAGSGFATGPDLARAAEEAAREALVGLGGAGADLVVVFASGPDPDVAGAALARAAEAVGAPMSIGCTAAGVFASGRSVEQGPGVAVWAAELPGVRLRSYHLETLRTGESLAVLGMPVLDDSDSVGLLLADPYSFPVDGFVERSTVSLRGLPLVGGLASGGERAGDTRLLLDGRVVARGAVGVVLGGRTGGGSLAGVRALVSQGCRPVGPPMTVTAAEGNQILGLAGRPALAKLRQVIDGLEPEDQALASGGGLHVGLAMDEYTDTHSMGDFLVRGIVGVDQETQSLAIGDVVTVGRTVQFQVRDADVADADLASLLWDFRRRGGIDPLAGALVFSCDGRGPQFFSDPGHDARVVREQLGVEGVAGFYGAGEIGPVAGRNHLHGWTASVLVVGEPAVVPASGG